MSSRYKLLQSDQNYYAFKEKNNSYFDGLTWKNVERSDCSYILNNEIDVSFQANRLGNILDYKYINESSNNGMNNIVNLTQFQFTNNYDVKPFHEYGIGDPSFINYCVSGDKYFYKPNTSGVINSGKFDVPQTFTFNSSTSSNNPYYECEDKALKSNVPYFVIGDINYSTNEASYNCYIPKFKNAYNTNVIKELVAPISKTINNIFESFIINDTLLFEKYLDASQNKINDYYFNDFSYHAIPGRNNFLIYTTDIYNFSPNTSSSSNTNPLENINKITQELNLLTSYKEYETLRDGILNPNKMSEYFYNSSNNDLKTYFYHFNCLNLTAEGMNFSQVNEYLYNSETGTEKKFDDKIREIYEQWRKLNEQNKKIVDDISRINIIGKDREKYLRDLYKVIENEQNELKKLLNNANGGIGRLKDQKYLRDNTILEINILILIIIFSLFLYSKIK